ncbi:hypothetical protein GGX14DRAFT_401037 [Mycena pura]|uniref:Uncharacterized protein n=1 Tax=Mycena pura TaxID=153505 RepID=A0AAD6YB21_9AGAR|nr:hypothetical protein GGX14DRAFT_401037 [Mycena pura]
MQPLDKLKKRFELRTPSMVPICSHRGAVPAMGTSKLGYGKWAFREPSAPQKFPRRQLPSDCVRDDFNRECRRGPASSVWLKRCQTLVKAASSTLDVSVPQSRGPCAPFRVGNPSVLLTCLVSATGLLQAIIATTPTVTALSVVCRLIVPVDVFAYVNRLAGKYWLQELDESIMMLLSYGIRFALFQPEQLSLIQAGHLAVRRPFRESPITTQLRKNFNGEFKKGQVESLGCARQEVPAGECRDTGRVSVSADLLIQFLEKVTAQKCLPSQSEDSTEFSAVPPLLCWFEDTPGGVFLVL